MKIEVKELNKQYKDFKALKDVNLNIEGPATIGLLGPNGAGKSTFMKLLVKQLIPTEGNIQVDGKDLNKNEKYLKERLGYLPQEFGLYDELTIEQFLDYMACLKNVKNRKSAVKNAVEAVNLNEKNKKKIKTLSGGQKQRVGIAQALLNDPELVIVDEPTVGLDPEERIKFRNIFSNLGKDKIVMLSTHIIDDVESICNRLIVLYKGKILFNGEPKKLVKSAVGHTAVLTVENKNEHIEENNFKIISTMVTPNGVQYRIVGDNLPSNAETITPTLEDAYVYCILKEGEK